MHNIKKIYIVLFFFPFLLLGDDFKNVTVLDIQSRSELKKYMKGISKDLGVKCSYCHDLDDKSIDTDTKNITREMIKLTRYLNDLLNVEPKEHDEYKTFVSCWTCHHGTPHPEHTRPSE